MDCLILSSILSGRCTEALLETISVIWALWTDFMVCLYESVWITPLFSVGTSLLAALGSFGILKGLTELIVHKSFW